MKVGWRTCCIFKGLKIYYGVGLSLLCGRFLREIVQVTARVTQHGSSRSCESF